MSYYKVKNIKLTQNKFSILCASNNLKPLRYDWINLDYLNSNPKGELNTLCDLIYKGEFELQSTKNKLMRNLKLSYQQANVYAGQQGKGWRFNKFNNSNNRPTAKNADTLKSHYLSIDAEDKTIVNFMEQDFIRRSF